MTEKPSLDVSALENKPSHEPSLLSIVIWKLISAVGICLALFRLLHPTSNYLPTKPQVTAGRGELVLSLCKDFERPFLCGTLVTPLNYANLSDPRNAAIAVGVYPAGGGATPKSQILGSLLLNPGGPGGSGRSFMHRSVKEAGNKTIAEVMDQQLNGKYNIVSFDPRGVGQTWPQVKCYTDELEALYFYSSAVANGLPGQHAARVLKHEVGTTIAQEQLLSQMCEKSEDAELLRYVGSALVVQDMRLLHQALGDAKLNYWGFSYGTVLGSTYADMFPTDVNRLIIDGVVDVPNYYKGKWSHAFRDIEHEFSAFFDECVISGVENCPLSKLVLNQNTSKPPGADLKQLVMDWGLGLKQRPVPLVNADPPQIFTYSKFIAGLFSAMYSPASWPATADGLYAAIAHRDLSQLTSSPGQVLSSEAIMQIACSDNLRDLEKNWDIADYEHYINGMRKDSPHFSEFFGQIGLMCNGIWPARASQRHTGNFTAETSFPLLALGNDFDPVTPGRYADKMASLFPNAISVRREGYGHCSGSQPSKCIDQIVKSYLLEGELPLPETYCRVDRSVFGSRNGSEAIMGLTELLHNVIKETNGRHVMI